MTMCLAYLPMWSPAALPQSRRNAFPFRHLDAMCYVPYTLARSIRNSKVLFAQMNVYVRSMAEAFHGRPRKIVRRKTIMSANPNNVFPGKFLRTNIVATAVASLQLQSTTCTPLVCWFFVFPLFIICFISGGRGGNTLLQLQVDNSLPPCLDDLVIFGKVRNLLATHEAVADGTPVFPPHEPVSQIDELERLSILPMPPMNPHDAGPTSE